MTDSSTDLNSEHSSAASESNQASPQTSSLPPIQNGDIVGRRLQQNQIVKQIGSEVRYAFEAFFDSRVADNISVDLLSVSGNVNKKSLQYLEPIAHKAFTKMKAKKPFAGWAGMRRKTVHQSILILRTPDLDPDNPNELHCDIVRPNSLRTTEGARALAFQLRANAEEDQLFVPSPTTTITVHQDAPAQSANTHSSTTSSASSSDTTNEPEK